MTSIPWSPWAYYTDSIKGRRTAISITSPSHTLLACLDLLGVTEHPWLPYISWIVGLRGCSEHVGQCLMLLWRQVWDRNHYLDPRPESRVSQRPNFICLGISAVYRPHSLVKLTKINMTLPAVSWKRSADIEYNWSVGSGQDWTSSQRHLIESPTLETRVFRRSCSLSYTYKYILIILNHIFWVYGGYYNFCFKRWNTSTDKVLPRPNTNIDLRNELISTCLDVWHCPPLKTRITRMLADMKNKTA